MSKQTELQDEHSSIVIDYFKQGNKRALAHLAMRYGKCSFTIKILKELYNYSPTLLIAYPDNKIKFIWEQEIIKWDYSNPNITFVNFSSLWKYKDKIFDFFCCDEVHECSLNELDICHQIMTNDEETYFLGLSGTISKETQEKWGIPILVEYNTLSGIADNILADYKITVHLVDLDRRVKTPNKKGKMLSEKEKYDNFSFVIQKMMKYGQNAMHLALSRNRLSLSSIGKMEFLRKLLLELKDKRVLVFTGLAGVADNIGIPSYHSKSSSDLDFRMFIEGKYNQLALAGIGKTGITYPNLDSVILLNFTYSAEESSQILNRAIKLDYEGKIADLHVICLREPPELKKVKESLSMLDQSKIKYI